MFQGGSCFIPPPPYVVRTTLINYFVITLIKNNFRVLGEQFISVLILLNRFLNRGILFNRILWSTLCLNQLSEMLELKICFNVSAKNGVRRATNFTKRNVSIRPWSATARPSTACRSIIRKRVPRWPFASEIGPPHFSRWRQDVCFALDVRFVS